MIVGKKLKRNQRIENSIYQYFEIHNRYFKFYTLYMKPLPVYMNAKHQKSSTKIFQKFLTFQLIGLILAEPSLKKVLVTDGRNKGKCLDGSPPGYYKKEFDPDVTIENKVLIELPAGAWCYWLETTHENEKGDGAHCSNRSNGSKGSSLNQYNKANKTINRYGMASESSDFNRWEYYEFIYCDGFSWQGRREEPLKTRDEKDLEPFPFNLLSQ